MNEENSPINNQTKPKKEIKPNIWLALLCGAGFGLVACVLWGVLYGIGTIAWAAGLLVIWAVMLGYSMFNNKKMDVKGYFICLAIAIVELVATIFITVGIVLAIELNISLGYAFSSMFKLLAEHQAFKEALLTDILVTIFMLVAGYVGYIVSNFILNKRAKRQLAKQEAREKQQKANASEIDGAAIENADKTNVEEKPYEIVEEIEEKKDE